MAQPQVLRLPAGLRAGSGGVWTFSHASMSVLFHVVIDPNFCGLGDLPALTWRQTWGAPVAG